MAFGNSGKSSLEDIVRKLLDRVKENSRRLRDVEEENRSMASSIRSLEERIIDLEDRQGEDVKELREKIDDLGTRVMKIENVISKIKDRLEEAPKKDEFEEVKNFVNLLSPMESQFVTESEVKRLIKQELQKEGR
ncbi:MAG: hypothetical protein ACLFQ8_01335 [Candidatus Aenigmatarchaeota archaeon]